MQMFVTVKHAYMHNCPVSSPPLDYAPHHQPSVHLPLPTPHEQNILLTADKRAKLADVGLSTILKNMSSTASFVSKPVAYGPTGGTAGYKDFNLEGEKRLYGSKNDVFSMGVVLLDCFPPDMLMDESVMGPIRSVIQRCVGAWDRRPTSLQLLEELREVHTKAKATYNAEVTLNVNNVFRAAQMQA